MVTALLSQRRLLADCFQVLYGSRMGQSAEPIDNNSELKLVVKEE